MKENKCTRLPEQLRNNASTSNMLTTKTIDEVAAIAELKR
jgi:hypothetical protein